MSGGPVITQGEVIGVALSSYRTQQQVNFAAPASAVKALLDRLAARPIAELPKLQIPMTAPRDIEQTFARGLRANGNATEIGAECFQAPANAKAITGVRGNLNLPGNVMVIVWLSPRSGLEGNDPRAFGHLFADRTYQPRFAPRYAFSIGNTDFPPELLCVNYTYHTPIVCMTCRFEVKYVVQYLVRSIPTQ